MFLSCKGTKIYLLHQISLSFSYVCFLIYWLLFFVIRCQKLVSDLYNNESKNNNEIALSCKLHYAIDACGLTCQFVNKHVCRMHIFKSQSF